MMQQKNELALEIKEVMEKEVMEKPSDRLFIKYIKRFII